VICQLKAVLYGILLFCGLGMVFSPGAAQAAADGGESNRSGAAETKIFELLARLRVSSETLYDFQHQYVTIKSALETLKESTEKLKVHSPTELDEYIKKEYEIENVKKRLAQISSPLDEREFSQLIININRAIDFPITIPFPVFFNKLSSRNIENDLQAFIGVFPSFSTVFSPDLKTILANAAKEYEAENEKWKNFLENLEGSVRSRDSNADAEAQRATSLKPD